MKDIVRRRRLTIAGIAVAAAIVLGGPDARLSILTHDRGDPNPHKVEASIGLGKLALSLLFTWTAHAR